MRTLGICMMVCGRRASQEKLVQCCEGCGAGRAVLVVLFRTICAPVSHPATTKSNNPDPPPK
eukprot:scaffold7381_cov310-Pinguiococcus_pyrenoidosus.AAC.28